MKNHTDIEQSRKLSEILPIESADMHYKVNRYNNESKIFMIPYSELGSYKDNEYQYCVCAWSLAALLSILPNGIVMNKDSQNGRYHFSSKYIGTYVTADNPVDACYEMILKLKENNLL